MYRLFVAVDLPDEIKERLLQLCCGVPGAKWIDESRMHLTLRFIGEVDGAVFRDAQEVLVTVKGAPFELSIKGVGFFPPRNKPETLWAGIEKNEMLVRLKNRVDTALRNAGIGKEGRKFAPHVQLARLAATPPGRLAGFLTEHALLSMGPFTVDEFSLYSSYLSSQRALHQVESTYPLLEKGRPVS